MTQVRPTKRGDSAAAEFAYAHAGATHMGLPTLRWPLRVLVIDSATVITSDAPEALFSRGIDLMPYSEGTGALIGLLKDEPALVVAPTDMAEIDLVRFVTAVVTWTEIPVVVGLGSEPGAGERAFQALEAGARSILALPFNADQISMAVRQMGFTADSSTVSMRIGPLTLDPQAHRLTVDGNDVNVTPREFELLRYLMRNHPRVVTVEELTQAANIYEDSTDAATRVHLTRLRKKLDGVSIAGGPSVLENVRGLGYRLRG
ncbi:DNA-binding response regulator [Mycetocola manganoxydans]|uniref:DNA-binding response regulator n=1 Tax=Mycetocola manganoxydans TaxID=699879 RepID=A0A3L6ZQU3_9MICO|nr:DNA-binding response regulator [Mycetocola manganoxydans]GHD49054.1 DNA-binding response regulator [Mycetocola manganoxydans]